MGTFCGDDVGRQPHSAAKAGFDRRTRPSGRTPRRLPPDCRASRPARAPLYVAAFQVDFSVRFSNTQVTPPFGCGLATTRIVRPSGRCHRCTCDPTDTVGSEQVLLPAPPIRLLGDLAFAAQPVEQQRIVGRAVRNHVEVPELLERLVEEAQLSVAVEDRDCCRQPVERVGMAADRALYSSRIVSMSLTSAAMPAEPSPPAKSVTAKI